MVAKNDALKVLDQLNNASGELKWTLLSLDECTGCALVISQDVILQKPYDFPGGCAITWDKCSIRDWLNTDFYGSLPECVRDRIIRSTTKTADNCGIPGGGDTEDNVFLLSIEEYNDMPAETRAAKLNGAPCWWWLRSPGYAATDVANVMANGVLDGGLRGHGFYSHCDCGGIRPAMYLNLA